MIQKRSAKRSRKDAVFNMRLPQEVLSRLREYAGSHGTSASAAAARLLDEGLRMALFPGIDFRFTPSGRQPHVTGTGMKVWELWHVWLDHDRDVASVLKNYPHLKASQVNVAAAYGEAFKFEEPPGWGTNPPFAREVRV
jgi:uncharacterized protein (DUF433 family)